MSINKTKIYTLSQGTAPYTVSVSSDLPCVTFTPQTQVSQDGSVQFQASFDTELCLDTATVTMQVVDAQGCNTSQVVNFDNPCESFSLGGIQFTPPYTFSSTALSPGCSSMGRNTWIYDTQVFNQVSVLNSNFGTSLTLELNPNLVTYPANSTIRLRVENCEGCIEEVTYVFNICSPKAQNFTVNLYCDEDNFESQFVTIPTPTGCTGITIDWDTLSIQSPSTFTVQTMTGTGNTKKVKLSSPLSTAAGTYTAQYSVQTEDGVPSSTGVISIVVNQCNLANTIFIPTQTIQRNCSTHPLPGDVMEIPAEDIVVVSSGATVDWSTFTVVTPPNSASPSITSSVGTLGDYVIDYEVPAPATGTDTFKWTVCDTNGNCADAGTVTVVLDCPAPPVATNDSYCVPCGETQTLDILANDLGGGSIINSQSISIQSSPLLGNVTIPGDGTVIYTAFDNTSGNDSFTYTVNNVQGDTSNVATVSVEVICAGEDSTLSLCN